MRSVLSALSQAVLLAMPRQPFARQLLSKVCPFSSVLCCSFGHAARQHSRPQLSQSSVATRWAHCSGDGAPLSGHKTRVAILTQVHVPFTSVPVLLPFLAGRYGSDLLTATDERCK